MKLEVLIRYIDKSVTRDEEKLVHNWLSENKKHEVYFNKVKKVLSSIDDYSAYFELDVSRDWKIVEKRLINQGKKQSRQIISINTVKPLSRIASIIIFVALISAVYYFINKPKQPGHQASFYEIVVPEGQKSEMTLTDGSKVWINAGSKLKLPNHFGGTTRDVWLDGEAFFEVTKNRQKPFLVHTTGINIKVLGTSFNVRAYNDEDLIETTLIEGKVTLQKSSDKNREIVTLEPNHKAVYFKTKDAYVSENLRKEIKQPLKVRKILISEPVNTEVITSWKEGKLIFEDEKLADIALRLERYYGVKIDIQDKRLNEVRYTGTIKKISIEQTIKALQLTTPFNYIINENSILISSKTKLPMESN